MVATQEQVKKMTDEARFREIMKALAQDPIYQEMSMEQVQKFRKDKKA